MQKIAKVIKGTKEVERTRKANGAVERVYVEQKQKKKGFETFPEQTKANVAPVTGHRPIPSISKSQKKIVGGLDSKSCRKLTHNLNLNSINGTLDLGGRS